MNDGQQGQPDEKTLEFGFHKNLDCLICMRLFSGIAIFTPRPMDIQLKLAADVGYSLGSAISVAKKSACSSCQSDRLILGPGPRCWRKLTNLGDLGCEQACEQILQIIERVDPMPPTTAHQRVNHRAAFPGFGMPDE